MKLVLGIWGIRGFGVFGNGGFGELGLGGRLLCALYLKAGTPMWALLGPVAGAAALHVSAAAGGAVPSAYPPLP